MREIDQAHDSQNERKPGSQQKYRHAKLQTVERLLKQYCEHRLQPFATMPLLVSRHLALRDVVVAMGVEYL